MKRNNEDLSSYEDTKEVINLDEFMSDKSEDESLLNFQNEIDQEMEAADLKFQEEIEQLGSLDNTIIIEKNSEEKLKELQKTSEQESEKNVKKTKKSLKEKWSGLDKKKKIAIIVGIVVFLIILIVLIVIFWPKKKEEVKEEIPDVIVLEDNYRYENGVLYFLDNKEEIGSYECQNKDENKCFVAYITENDDFDDLKKVDENGEKIALRSKIYDKRYVFIADNDGSNEIIKLYDIENQEVKDDYLEVKAYDSQNDVVVLKNTESKYGLVSFKDGEPNEIVPFKYDELGILSDDKNLERMVVKQSGSYYLINKDNNILTSAILNKIVGANGNVVKAKDEMGKYHAYDYEGKDLGNGDYITLLDNYLVFVRDLKLFITDNEKNLMNVDGIPLQNDSFIPVATYNNNHLEKTEKSFDVEVYDKTLTIRIYNANYSDSESKTLNLQEGLLSKDLKFISYFDGKLYIYKDETKEQLAGFYECSNKNLIETKTKELKSCYLASESTFGETRGNDKEKDESSSLGILPLFFERYIFIHDGEGAMVLYDLKENTAKAWYKEVDAKIYSKAETLTEYKEKPVYYIGVSQRSNKYGLAKITENSVEVQIPFEYDSIKRLGDYYVLERPKENSDGKEFYLVDIGGKALTNAKQNPIVDYVTGYVKTFKDNKYMVSGFNDDETNTLFDYVELYDNYYAAVTKKNNKYTLDIYRYNDEEPVSEDASNIPLVLNNFDGDGTRAFRLTFNNNKIFVEIGQTNESYQLYKTIDPTKNNTSSQENNSSNKDEEKNEEKED